MLDRPEEYQKMYDTETKLWWYRHLHRLVLRAIRNLPRDAVIADLACGTGGLIARLAEEGYGEVWGMDLSEDAIRLCAARNIRSIRADLRDAARHIEAESLDALICNDALCYFEPAQQEAVIRTFHSLLKPGGLLVMNVPAFTAFSGMHDRGVGIVHRFSSEDVRRLTAPFRKHTVRYWPLALAPLIYATRVMQRRALRKDPSMEPYSDVALPHPIVNALLYGLTSVEMVLPLALPLASSAFITANK